MSDQELTKLRDDLRKFLHELVDEGAVYHFEPIGKTIQAIENHRLGHQLGKLNELSGMDSFTPPSERRETIIVGNEEAIKDSSEEEV